jgi:hypothetical protein
MTEKFDPRLLDLVERIAQGASEQDATLTVLLALDAVPDDAVRNDLENRGLTLRSIAGDVLTGTVRLGDVSRLAASPHVITVELSSALYLEGSEGMEPLQGE